MKTKNIYIIALSLVIAAMGCDNAKHEADEAAREAAKTRVSAEAEQAELQRKQSEAKAELERKQKEQQSNLAAELERKSADANDKTHDAKAEFEKEKRDFSAKTKESLENLNARAEELKVKAGDGATRAQKFAKEQIAAFITEKNIVDQKFAKLGETSVDAWERTKKDLDLNIDKLEKHLDLAAKKM